MNHPEERGKETFVCVCAFVDVCASLSLFMGRSVTYEKIIWFYVCTALRASERMIAHTPCVAVCVCASDAELEGCVGRSILCWCKLISRIQTLGALRRKKSCVPQQPFMKGGEVLYACLCLPLCV